MELSNLSNSEEITLFSRFLTKLNETQQKITETLCWIKQAFSQAETAQVEYSQFLEDIQKMIQASQRAETIILGGFDLEVGRKSRVR